VLLDASCEGARKQQTREGKGREKKRSERRTDFNGGGRGGLTGGRERIERSFAQQPERLLLQVKIENNSR
jgi:hypothetical protein